MRTSQGPLCAPAKNEEETNRGGGGAAFWVGSGRGYSRGVQSEKGTRQCDIKSDESADCSLSPPPCMILKGH